MHRPTADRAGSGLARGCAERRPQLGVRRRRSAVSFGGLDLDLPILGICYGMQAMASAAGARVERADRREYGPAELRGVGESEHPLAATMAGARTVWMSHGDHVSVAPDGWLPVAESDNCPVAAMVSTDGRRAALQFHPEVTHSEGGTESLARVCPGDVWGIRNWTMGSFVDREVAAIRAGGK